MGLQGGAQVVVRLEGAPGQVSCEAFDTLAMVNPAIVTILHSGSADAQDHAATIRDALVAELLTLGARALTPPCDGNRVDAEGCHALREPVCQKLLVLAGDAHQPFGAATPVRRWLQTDDTFAILPVMPEASRIRVTSLLPAGVGIKNANFWTKSPADALPAILAQSGITSEQPRIFISYRQADSASLAIQLFDALSHAGFDAFLDHFRIPPGVNFQARLTQELGDKAMVLFLESATFLTSQWVTYEVNVAKACGLGVCALNIDGAGKTEIDDELRRLLGPADFVGGVFDSKAELLDAPLADIVSWVRREHDRAFVERRRMLRESLKGAILKAGGAPPVSVNSGHLRIDSVGPASKSYLVALTPRPPDLPDFHGTHAAVVHPTAGVVVGLSSLMEPARMRRLSWLAGVTTLALVDEGDLLAAARQMVQGTL